MRNKLCFVWLCGSLTIIVAICCAAPVGPVTADDSELREGYLVDDMILGVMRNGLIAPPKIWPNATVHYKISSDFETYQVDAIEGAMGAIEAVTCVRFLEADNSTKAYVNFQVAQKGCSSVIGYNGRPQRLNLQKDLPKCFKPATLIHELLHALGFYHQHMAPERDDYITVYWENILPGHEKAFAKLDNMTVTDFGFGYDYDSVMHYGRKGFSVNGLDTILPLDSNAIIGQHVGLSDKDICKVNAMYKCAMEDSTANICEIN